MRARAAVTDTEWELNGLCRRLDARIGFRVGADPAVDRLMRITAEEHPPAPRAGVHRERQLGRAEVLRLIDQDVLVALRPQAQAMW